MTHDGYSSRYFDVRDADGTAIATFCEGPLNEEENIDQLGQSLFGLVEQKGFRQVVVDLARVSFVTSSVLSKLITLHRKLNRVEGRLLLCGLQETVQRVMQRSNLLEYFDVFEPVDTARAEIDGLG